MSARPWQFWIDVGGTFTDCLGISPAGTIVRRKVLSSGIIKGRVGTISTRSRIQDSLRAADADGIWNGYRLRVLNRSGSTRAESSVQRFSATDSTLQLATPLTTDITAGLTYELYSDEEAPLVAVRLVLGLPLASPLPAISIRLATTRGTNALLTRRGAPTTLVTTKGFADILAIGYQERPELFAVEIQKPEPLYAQSIEIDERIDAHGQVLQQPDERSVKSALQELKAAGTESLAICLLHADRYPQHEQLVADWARQIGFRDLSCSHEASPQIKIVSRGDTTVVDAYLTPVIRSYVQSIQTATPGPESNVRMLTSAGGLTDAELFRGKDSILSGPAGGVVGFSQIAQAAGFSKAIGFDMGGTSTDVSRFEGHFEKEYETVKAGVRIVTPMLAIETVAAGGGSICHYDGTRLVVGPASAASDPGPACYGRGGPLAITDVNLFLGRLPADQFPFPLDQEAVGRRLEEVQEQVAQQTGQSIALWELAEGFLRIANTNMANAIRTISIAQGYDPREYLLVAFGGAAGQHACAIAEELGMAQILHHPDAGILSAYGVGLADVARHRSSGVYLPLESAGLTRVVELFGELEAQARRDLADEGVDANRIRINRVLDLRYQGTDSPLSIDEPSDGNYVAEFTRTHQRQFGYVHDRRTIEIVTARVEARGISEVAPPPSAAAEARALPASEVATTVRYQGRKLQVPIYRRESLEPGHRLAGPVIVLERSSTAIIDPGWHGEVLSGGEILVRRQQNQLVAVTPGEQSAPPGVDPILLEIFNSHFAGIARQMGITLQRTSSSVNVKERLDFSCALFTASGELVVNAPHIPVHLGAMSETVKCVLKDNPDLVAGDVFLTNDPYRGGSHLPDLTVVTPVHDPTGKELLFFTASRAHHAEIGGITPGSMPPFSKNLGEEGVLIRNYKLIAGGELRLDGLRELLQLGEFPSRNMADNLADVLAQVAANQQGSRDLQSLIDKHGWSLVQSYMGHIQDAAARKVRQALAHLEDGAHTFSDHLDDGSTIAVRLQIEGDQVQVDFSGTSDVLPSNLNANRAIVTAAIMYSLRLLIDEDIPLNEGVLDPVKLQLPTCLLNPPGEGAPADLPAMAGGNVETSQRVVDVLLGALQLAAASQGTMNNLLFGDSSFGYYETICGGSGATANAEGASAVQTHMTNTRLTDPEILEQRFPVRLRRFQIRHGSGGAGQKSGGDGVIREIEFLKPLEVSILAQRRGQYAPYGLQGGRPGAVGTAHLVRAEGQVEVLSGREHFSVEAGDRLVIETPGGGGYGPPS